MLDNYIQRDTTESSVIDRLSEREAEVFRLFGNGLTTGEVAEQL